MSRMGWDLDEPETADPGDDPGIRSRLNLFRLIIVLAMGVLLYRVIYLQQIGGLEYQALAEENRFATLPISAPRGVIFDRNGNLFADNVPSFNVTITPAFLPENEDELMAVFQRLSLLTGVPITNTTEQQALIAAAVNGVSFDIAPGETLALVGESGSGKSTLARVLLRLEQPDGGTVRFDGTDIFTLDRRELAAIRRRMQIVFQDPYSSLDPRMTVRGIVAEGIELHGLAKNKGEVDDRVRALLARVGLRRADFLHRGDLTGHRADHLGAAD